jgi:hypothetical protein
MTEQDIASRFAGGSVEHVDKIQNEEGVGGSLAGIQGTGDKCFKKHAVEVNNGVNAARNANAQLAMGEEIGSKVRCQMSKGDSTSQAAEAGANADWTEVSGVSGGFVEGQEVGGTEERGNGIRDRALKDELKDVGKRLKIRAGSMLGIVTAFEKGKVSEEVSVISKGASGSAFFDGTEGFEERSSLDSER